MVLKLEVHFCKIVMSLSPTRSIVCLLVTLDNSDKEFNFVSASHFVYFPETFRPRIGVFKPGQWLKVYISIRRIKEQTMRYSQRTAEWESGLILPF